MGYISHEWMAVRTRVVRRVAGASAARPTQLTALGTARENTLMALPPHTHLETPYVFVDAQAYISNGCDWSGIHLRGLVELACEGSLKLLYTTITRREVLRQMEEKVKDALQRAGNMKAMMRSAGFDLAPISDGLMYQRLAAAFDQYLTAASAVEVPLTVNLDQLLDDYFERRAPFSASKPKEFPDAIVCASLANWSKINDSPIYIISKDPDFEAYCSTNPSLKLLKTVPDLLSRAVVSREMLYDLAQRLRGAAFVRQKLADALVKKGVREPMFGFFPRVRGIVKAAKVINIGTVNVVGRKPNKLLCEFEFEAQLELMLRITDETKPLMDFASREYDASQVVDRSFIATIEADRVFGQAGFNFQDVHVSGDEIIVSRSEVPPPTGVFD